jgi:hypothetical protein
LGLTALTQQMMQLHDDAADVLMMQQHVLMITLEQVKETS